jgi:hypothetical protein
VPQGRGGFYEEACPGPADHGGASACPSGGGGSADRDSFEETFEDVNPCTGLTHTVTITGTIFEHSHDGRIVVINRRTITTDPTGFVGHGVVSFVANGQVERFSLTDILANPAGDRIRAHFVGVLDLSTDTVRVEKGELTCLGPA